MPPPHRQQLRRHQLAAVLEPLRELGLALRRLPLLVHERHLRLHLPQVARAGGAEHGRGLGRVLVGLRNGQVREHAGREAAEGEARRLSLAVRGAGAIRGRCGRREGKVHSPRVGAGGAGIWLRSLSTIFLLWPAGGRAGAQFACFAAAMLLCAGGGRGRL